MNRLLLLGESAQQMGEFRDLHLEGLSAFISAGSDPDSPSMIHKGSKACINEDAAAVVRADGRLLLAVADGHHGHEVSHHLIQRIHEMAVPPRRMGQLSLWLGAEGLLNDQLGGSALLIAVVDEQSGAVFGFSFGDCSVVTLSPGGVRWRNTPNQIYLRSEQPVPIELASTFDFVLKSGEVLLLFTDGINECCYRNAHLSVQTNHLKSLYEDLGSDVKKLGAALVNLALTGVDGNPGGQDNLSVVAYARP
ncbi:SpoIIE family protein phosphatase [bacterium]|nr:SpoIIE family protein phosphatase [bacterium]